MASAAARRLLVKFRDRPQPRAASLIITLFGDAVAPHGGRVWLGSLIQLLAPLGVSERLVRTSVYRLTQERWLRAETLGRRSDYTLTDFGRRQFEGAARHIYSAARPDWDGRWRLVLTLPGNWSAPEREHLRRTLAYQGFGQLNSGVYLHPSADLAAALRALESEDFPQLGAKLAAFHGAPDGALAQAQTLVAEAWNLAELSAAYAAFTRRFEPLGRAARATTPPLAFQLRTVLIHEYRRLLLRDPELPPGLLPPDWRGAGAHALAAALYRALAPASEAYLREHLRTADSAHPRLEATFRKRFGGIRL